MYYISQVNCNLLGHTPGTMAMSSIAMLPKLFLPTVPSNTICNNKETFIIDIKHKYEFIFLLVYVDMEDLKVPCMLVKKKLVLGPCTNYFPHPHLGSKFSSFHLSHS